MRPIGVIYENEAWLAPTFAALDAVGAPYERLFAADAIFDPSGRAPEWSLAVNKVSPSSYLRDHEAAIGFGRAFLPFLEERGVPVVNGSAAFELETSKARQLILLGALDVRAPRAQVVTQPSQAAQAAESLRFPVIVKPNVGGSGALMQRYETVDALRDAAAIIDFGPDGTGIVQEYLAPGDGSIVRIEFLDDEYLYAIRITNDRDQDFNLCPADICQVPTASIEFDNNPLDAPTKKPLRIEAFDPPGAMIDTVLRIARAGHLDVGGVEYLVAARDGLPYVYDVNALSNFVTDAPALVGFDPHARFARWLLARASDVSQPTLEEAWR
ncbi:MAG: ATP-grasp domain-containing protein [Candidatus Limnocylindria bacterium]